VSFGSLVPLFLLAIKPSLNEVPMLSFTGMMTIVLLTSVAGSLFWFRTLDRKSSHYDKKWENKLFWINVVMGASMAVFPHVVCTCLIALIYMIVMSATVDNYRIDMMISGCADEALKKALDKTLSMVKAI